MSCQRTARDRRTGPRQHRVCRQDRNTHRERHARLGAADHRRRREGRGQRRGSSVVGSSHGGRAGTRRAGQERSQSQREHAGHRRGLRRRARLDDISRRTVHLCQEVERHVVRRRRRQRRGQLGPRSPRRAARRRLRTGARRKRSGCTGPTHPAPGATRRRRRHRTRRGSCDARAPDSGRTRRARAAGTFRRSSHARLLRAAGRCRQDHLRRQRPIGGRGRGVARPRLTRHLRRRARAADRTEPARARRRRRCDVRASAARPEAGDGARVAVRRQQRRDDRRRRQRRARPQGRRHRRRDGIGEFRRSIGGPDRVVGQQVRDAALCRR